MHRGRLQYQFLASHRTSRQGFCLEPDTKSAVREMTPPRENRCSQMNYFAQTRNAKCQRSEIATGNTVVRRPFLIPHSIKGNQPMPLFGALDSNRRRSCCQDKVLMVMLHQMRHCRQENHATNHARCGNRIKSMPIKGRKHGEAKQSEPYISQIPLQQRLLRHVLQRCTTTKTCTPSMPREGAHTQSKGEREPGCEQAGKDNQVRCHLCPSPEPADHARQNRVGRPEAGGSLQNNLLHCRTLPWRRMNQRPQTIPT
jgi:hypothetical protein